MKLELSPKPWVERVGDAVCYGIWLGIVCALAHFLAAL